MSRPKMTPSERGSIAALTRWAKENPKATAERGQQGLKAKFLREVDEHAAEVGEVLTEAERQRRATVRYRLHMKRIRRERTIREAAAAAEATERAPSELDGAA